MIKAGNQIPIGAVIDPRVTARQKALEVLEYRRRDDPQVIELTARVRAMLNEMRAIQAELVKYLETFLPDDLR